MPSEPDRRRGLLHAVLGVALLDGVAPELALVRAWLDTWTGIGHLAAGMARQGYDVSLTRYNERGWRATFYLSGIEHSATGATGTGRESTPWRAVQRAAWAALTASVLSLAPIGSSTVARRILHSSYREDYRISTRGCVYETEGRMIDGIAQVDFHGCYPEEISSEMIAEKLEAARARGARGVRLIHGHGMNRASWCRTFTRSNTGFLGQTIRRILRHDQGLRRLMKAHFDCSDPGATTVHLRPETHKTAARQRDRQRRSG